ncbi:uncharacterized protein [Ptychodera flava]|uniref:uncharacterized protein isoform X2 n=1 Tax=Ptychodera flava TaxID=63121 RepID=UPI003969ED25
MQTRMSSLSHKMSAWFIALCIACLCDGPIGGVKQSTALPTGGCGRHDRFCEILQRNLDKEDGTAGANVAKRRCIPGQEFSFWCKAGRSVSDATGESDEPATVQRRVPSLKQGAEANEDTDCPVNADGEIDPACQERRRKRMMQRRHCMPGMEFSFYCRGKKSDDYFSKLAGANLAENDDNGNTATGIMLKQLSQK